MTAQVKHQLPLTQLRANADNVIETQLPMQSFIINPKKLETGLRTNSAGIPYTLLLRIEAAGFPTLGLLL